MASLPPTFGPPSNNPPATQATTQEPTLPPMVGGNELPPIERMVVGSSSEAPAPPSQPREPVEGEAVDHHHVQLAPPSSTYPTGSTVATAPTSMYSGAGAGPSSYSPAPPPLVSSAPPATQQVEERSEAAGSEHRTAEMMAPTPAPSRPAPLPTPGRDIAGEESGGGGGSRRRGSREPAWDSDEEIDS